MTSVPGGISARIFHSSSRCRPYGTPIARCAGSRAGLAGAERRHPRHRADSAPPGLSLGLLSIRSASCGAFAHLIRPAMSATVVGVGPCKENTMRKAMLITAAALIALTGAASAQDWPSRPITMVIPFAPGGGIDASGRIQALHMGELLGQTIVVENIGAAAGMTGSQRVAKAPPDGYTFLMGNTGTHAYNQTLYKKPLYDAAADFQPVGLVTESPRILLARKDLPVNNLQEFIAYVKANQAKMQFGSAGVGSGTHLPCVLLNLALGVDVTHVPYRGAGPVMQDLIAGRIDYMCGTVQTGAAQAKQGAVKGIAVMAPKRVPII